MNLKFLCALLVVVFATFSVRFVSFRFALCVVLERTCPGVQVPASSFPPDSFRHPFRVFTVVESNEARFCGVIACVCVLDYLFDRAQKATGRCYSLLAGLIVVALLALGTCVPVLACHTPRTRTAPKLVNPTSSRITVYLFVSVFSWFLPIFYYLLRAVAYDTVTSTYTYTHTHRSTHRCVAVRSKNNQVVVVN